LKAIDIKMKSNLFIRLARHFLDKKSFDQMSFDQMSFDQMSFDQMSFDQMLLAVFGSRMFFGLVKFVLHYR
jgi:hypothetical protein